MDDYLERRQKLATRYGDQSLWKVIDPWPLYVGIQNLGRNIALMETIRQTVRVPGDVLEFGAWHGATTLLFAKMLQLVDPHGIKVVHAFDIWEGGFELARWRAQDNPDVATQYAGTYAGDLGVILDMLRLYRLEAAVELHRGRIEETWPQFRDARPAQRVSVALMDVDLYEPTKAALQGLHERMSVGGFIVFDEYGFADWPGETQAADEFMAAHPSAYETITNAASPQPSLLLRRKPS